MSLLGALAVGIGGAAGALLRALVGRCLPADFPWATLLVNVAGSFLLAAAYSCLPADAEWARLLIGSGFCGALTTFSTAILETLLLWRTGRRAASSLYLAGTVLLCVLASAGGIHLLA